jgi:hypothetical protein
MTNTMLAVPTQNTDGTIEALPFPVSNGKGPLDHGRNLGGMIEYAGDTGAGAWTG